LEQRNSNVFRSLPAPGRVGFGAIEIRQISEMVELCRFALMSNPIYSDFVQGFAVSAWGLMEFYPPFREDERHCMTYSARDYSLDFKHGKYARKGTKPALAGPPRQPILPNNLNTNPGSRVTGNSEAEKRRVHTHLFGSDAVLCLGAQNPDFSNIVRRLLKPSHGHMARRLLRPSNNRLVRRLLKSSRDHSCFGSQILHLSGG
jgi:hypothetical protein